MMDMLDLLSLWSPFDNETAFPASIYQQILEAVVTKLKALPLGGIAEDSIILRKIPTNREFDRGLLTLPGIIVSPWRGESETGGTNLRDDVVYPVIVDLVQKSNEDQEENLPRFLLWRERILKAFRHQRLSGVDEVMTCSVEVLSVFNTSVFAKGYDHSAIVLKFTSRELRGG